MGILYTPPGIVIEEESDLFLVFSIPLIDFIPIRVMGVQTTIPAQTRTLVLIYVLAHVFNYSIIDIPAGLWYSYKMKLNKMIEEAMNEIPTNLTWDEGDVWKGWTCNSSRTKYYFDDIGNESIMDLWSEPFLRQAEDS